MKAVCCALVLFAALCLSAIQAGEIKVGSVSFLVTVNDTWKYDPPISNDTCMVTIKTDDLYPDTPLNKSENIQVGDCDNGPLVYSVNGQGEKSSIYLTFHSSVILDASPPTCTIDWNYEYKVPSHYIGFAINVVANESLLPGCATGDSREGYHMTYYWFYIIDWSLTTTISANSKLIPKYPVQPLAVSSISFLVAVNTTDTNPPCIATSKTPPLQPGVIHNDSQAIRVGNCDKGRLDFNITQEMNQDEKMHTNVEVTFYSSAILDAGPVLCKIQWDYAYRVPTEEDSGRSLLPGCYTVDSREGFLMTYYWIYVIDWSYGQH